MSKKARRRPSWGKYRQKYGKWVGYYQPTLCIVGEDVLKFLNDLYDKQEPLGEEFEKVLYDNLWELYEKD